MYGVNIYQNYPKGEFRLLETMYVYAKSREDAKKIVLEYAQEKYGGMNISVMNVN